MNNTAIKEIYNLKDKITLEDLNLLKYKVRHFILELTIAKTKLYFYLFLKVDGNPQAESFVFKKANLFR